MKTSLVAIVLIVVTACSPSKKENLNYPEQAGDTRFDEAMDNPNFKFCDSTNVLHKRAYVKYEGGSKAMENELIEYYKVPSKPQMFSGFIVIRFAVNCNNQAGRYRTEILDSNCNPTTCSKPLKQNIMNAFKKLKYWNHPVYEDEHYDGYSFYVIKMENGKIVRT